VLDRALLVTGERRGGGAVTPSADRVRDLRIESQLAASGVDEEEKRPAPVDLERDQRQGIGLLEGDPRPGWAANPVGSGGQCPQLGGDRELAGDRVFMGREVEPVLTIGALRQ
jgi:hypothetical protein